ncbi:glycosyltransferase [Carboxylicivirga sp. RSCT41]|uniref:glycosyltransferase n=1 Tax=Carboxylicivirga agarovorans TaxID=3417570 RepID=UPI003D353A92
MAEVKSHRRILVSPLNWGLGHATRLIPVISALIKQGHYVIIAGEGASLSVLRNAFPELDWILLPGFNVSLSHHQFQWFKLLKQVPSFIRALNEEHVAVNKLIKSHKIDLLISDNRYGIYSKQVSSVIITHQTNPYPGKYLSWIRPFTRAISTRLIKQFDECWIPDNTNEPRLSGSLSTPAKRLKYKYIGYLSRLNPMLHTSRAFSTDVLIILSGPEPQRTQLEQILIDQLRQSQLKTTILCARPDKKTAQIGTITLLPHCTAEEQNQLINNSKYIICRSGYSTLMDLMLCNRTALLIPTPGQYEQEYLAQRACTLFGFQSISQSELKKGHLPAKLKHDNNLNKTIQTPGFKLPSLPLKK